MGDRKSFIMYMSWMPMMRNLPDATLAQLMKAIAAYQIGEEYEIEDPAAFGIFQMIKVTFDEDTAKYEETCARRAEAGSIGGKQKVANASKGVAKPSKGKQKLANATDNEFEYEFDIDTDLLKDKKIIAPSDSSEPAADLEAIPLNDGTEWTPTTSEAAEYERLYPAVDLAQEFRNMRGWCKANPARKKTPRGVRAFVNTWLSKEQNRGRKAPPPEPKRNTFADMEEHDHDVDALERELLLKTIRGA